METINERIAWLVSNNRKCNTKTSFAKEIGISQPFLSQVCNGDRAPSDRTIADICRVFGVNKAWLETGTGDPFQEVSRSDYLAEVFGGILSGHKSEKNAFIEAVAQLPDELFPVFVKSWIEAAERMKETLEQK